VVGSSILLCQIEKNGEKPQKVFTHQFADEKREILMMTRTY